MNDEEIRRMFNSIEPEDFMADTSATDSYKATTGGAGPFHAFVNEMHDLTRITFASHDGAVKPLAILQSSNERRIFQPESDELLEHFYRRLQREAREMSAEWFYTAAVGAVGLYKDIPNAPVEEFAKINLHNAESIQAATEAGILQTGMMWFAEAKEPNYEMLRIGVLEHDDEGQRLLDSVEGHPSGASWLYKLVLA